MTPGPPLPDPVTLAPESAAKVRGVLLFAAFAAGLASIVGFFLAPKQFFFSYLVGMVYVTSISLGALFWVMVHYLTAAGWSVVIRRIAENVTWVLPVLALLFIPLILNVALAGPSLSIFEWTNPVLRDSDSLLQRKQPWLSVNFFLGRIVFYIAMWSIIAHFLRSWSARQDQDGDPKYSIRACTFTPPFTIILALTSSFFAFDWLMSLDWRWYSTMYGVYFWAGAIQSAMATLTLVVLGLRWSGYLRNTITVEHTHDMGKILFGFTVFWTYIAFSQYFLIWYANLPEETFWFIRRRTGWNPMSYGLVLGRFLIPFAWLLRRSQKRNDKALAIGAAWLVFMQFYDLYWQIMPNLHVDGPEFHWLDLTCPIALVSIAGLVFLRALGSRPMIPVGDPRLGESLRHVNHW